MADALEKRDIAGSDELPVMDEVQFERWTELLRERTGMMLPAERKSFLVTSVGLRMRAIGMTDFQSYYDYLHSGQAGRLEWAALLDHLTVQETRFFRDPSAIEVVREHFLPMACERIRGGRSVNVWSAGCATGEEAYTLAMLLDEAVRAGGLRPFYGVTGSDISLRALGTARQAKYSLRRLASIPERYSMAYCEPAAPSHFRIVDGLRPRVCFAQANLLEIGDAPIPGMDLIYCQNVLIYFSHEYRQRIVEQMLDRLLPGGILVLGVGELLKWRPPGLRRIGGSNVLAFRRQDA